MRRVHSVFVAVLSIMLTVGAAGCHPKSLPCPKQPSKRNRVKVHVKGAQGEAIRVPKDKNGRVKRGLL